MPPKKCTAAQKVIVNPFKNRGIGSRTGKNIKAGKNIRKIAGGFENFDDYWSESDADLTKDGTFISSDTPKATQPSADGTSSSCNQMRPPSIQAAVSLRGPELSYIASAQSLLGQSQVSLPLSSIGTVKNINPYLNKGIGRRTGRDVKAGKNIRLVDGGFENFDDYWSESDADSMVSLSMVSASSTRNSSGPADTSCRSSDVSWKASAVRTVGYPPRDSAHSITFTAREDVDNTEGNRQEESRETDDGQEVLSQETDSQEALSQEADRQEVLSQETDSQEVLSQETDSQEALSQEADRQEVLSQETDSQEALSQEADRQEDVSQETDCQEADSQEHLNQETYCQEDPSQEADSQEEVVDNQEESDSPSDDVESDQQENGDTQDEVDGRAEKHFVLGRVDSPDADSHAVSLEADCQKEVNSQVESTEAKDIDRLADDQATLNQGRESWITRSGDKQKYEEAKEKSARQNEMYARGRVLRSNNSGDTVARQCAAKERADLQAETEDSGGDIIIRNNNNIKHHPGQPGHRDHAEGDRSGSKRNSSRQTQHAGAYVIQKEAEAADSASEQESDRKTATRNTPGALSGRENSGREARMQQLAPVPNVFHAMEIEEQENERFNQKQSRNGRPVGINQITADIEIQNLPVDEAMTNGVRHVTGKARCSKDRMGVMDGVEDQLVLPEVCGHKGNWSAPHAGQLLRSQMSSDIPQQTQMTLSQSSPLPNSQMSSVRLNLAGDVTGSISRLSGNTLSPGPHLFGTRKRLSYSLGETPKKAETSKTTQRSAMLGLKPSSRAPVSAAIPEHHPETDDEAVTLPSSQDTEELSSRGALHASWLGPDGALPNVQEVVDPRKQPTLAEVGRDEPSRLPHERQKQDPQLKPASVVVEKHHQTSLWVHQPADGPKPHLQKQRWVSVPDKDDECHTTDVEKTTDRFLSLTSQIHSRTAISSKLSDSEEEGLFAIVEDPTRSFKPAVARSKLRSKRGAGTSEGQQSSIGSDTATGKAKLMVEKRNTKVLGARELPDTQAVQARLAGSPGHRSTSVRAPLVTSAQTSEATKSQRRGAASLATRPLQSEKKIRNSAKKVLDFEAGKQQSSSEKGKDVVSSDHSPIGANSWVEIDTASSSTAAVTYEHEAAADDTEEMQKDRARSRQKRGKAVVDLAPVSKALQQAAAEAATLTSPQRRTRTQLACDTRVERCTEGRATEDHSATPGTNPQPVDQHVVESVAGREGQLQACEASEARGTVAPAKHNTHQGSRQGAAQSQSEVDSEKTQSRCEASSPLQKAARKGRKKSAEDQKRLSGSVVCEASSPLQRATRKGRKESADDQKRLPGSVVKNQDVDVEMDVDSGHLASSLNVENRRPKKKLDKICQSKKSCITHADHPEKRKASLTMNSPSSDAAGCQGSDTPKEACQNLPLSSVNSQTVLDSAASQDLTIVKRRKGRPKKESKSSETDVNVASLLPVSRSKSDLSSRLSGRRKLLETHRTSDMFVDVPDIEASQTDGTKLPMPPAVLRKQSSRTPESAQTPASGQPDKMNSRKSTHHVIHFGLDEEVDVPISVGDSEDDAGPVRDEPVLPDLNGSGTEDFRIPTGKAKKGWSKKSLGRNSSVISKHKDLEEADISHSGLNKPGYFLIRDSEAPAVQTSDDPLQPSDDPLQPKQISDDPLQPNCDASGTEARTIPPKNAKKRQHGRATKRTTTLISRHRDSDKVDHNDAEKSVKKKILKCQALAANTINNKKNGDSEVQEKTLCQDGEKGLPVNQDLSTPVALSGLDNAEASALKSGISFRRFSHVPSSLRSRRSRQLLYGGFADDEDIVSSPTAMKRLCPANMSVSETPAADPTGSGASLAPRRNKRRGRRVTISENITQHHLSHDEQERGDANNTTLPSMSATPVHYYEQASPATPFTWHSDENKIVYPEDKADGLRRSQRTRVRPIEWYKNERIIYDRSESGPVVVAVQPSRERQYLEHERQQRRRRRQLLLARKKQRAMDNGILKRRLSTHVPIPANFDVTVSTDIPVYYPGAQQEVLMGCFNPLAAAQVMGPRGGEPSPEDPFTMRLVTKQKLFTTGVLTLAPTAEKPCQRAISTAVLFAISHGKLLITINRATTILESGDHFFVPRGAMYGLKNLRNEAATLTFVNLMVETDSNPDPSEQDSQELAAALPRQESRQ